MLGSSFQHLGDTGTAGAAAAPDLGLNSRGRQRVGDAAILRHQANGPGLRRDYLKIRRRLQRGQFSA